jgi:hypothetical protein
VLTDVDLGTSEYTNGNFLSRDTIFKNFVLPSQSSLEPNFFVEPVEAEFRRYLGKISEGESINHFVTEGMLYNSLADAFGASPVPVSGWYLDDRVHHDYAARLLPRAVGYSAALLDYFFRGKLDVDLVEADPSDERIVRLSGTNASPDKLDGGTLTLYADTPDPVAPTSSLRGGAAALDPVLTVTADPDAPVESARFRIPEDASRFVAVYQGALGLEAPNSTFPGGVIGRIFETGRVEELFSDGTRWHLRTLEGVFPLPILASGAPTPDDQIEELRWGDVDNTLIGRTRFGVGAPNLFRKFGLATFHGEKYALFLRLR